MKKAANWGDPYANMMPISICCRHMTQHGVQRPSGDRIKVKYWGIPTELVTPSIAPVIDILRAMQLTEPLPIRIVPALNTLLRMTARFSTNIPSMKP